VDETQADIWRQCEEQGEDATRLRLERGDYGERKQPYVRLWLDAKERERLAARDARNDALETANLSIAERAAIAAEEAASEARKANRIAKIALATAIIIPIVIAFFTSGGG
jgi:hypothetical protein